MDGSPQELLAAGFGLDPAILTGDPATVLGQLRNAPVLHPDALRIGDDTIHALLTQTLTREVERLVRDSLDDASMRDLGGGSTDALDRLLASLEAAGATEDAGDSGGGTGEEDQQ